MILAQVWEAIFAQTSTGHSIFSRAFQAQILLGCEASVPQLSKLVHNLHIHAKMGALRTKFKVKIYHGDWDQIFHTFKKLTFWHPLTQKLVKMVMPQYIEGGFMLFSKINDSHSTTSDQISWLHSISKSARPSSPIKSLNPAIFPVFPIPHPHHRWPSSMTWSNPMSL